MGVGDAPVRCHVVVEFSVHCGRCVGTLVVDGADSIVSFTGGRQLERALISQFADQVWSAFADGPLGDDPLRLLTDTERAIAQLVSTGATNREIADALHYSVKSIEAHLTRMYRMLGVGGRQGLAGLLAEC